MYVSYVNGQFILTCQNGNIFTSANGTTWTLKATGTQQAYSVIRWTGSLYVASNGRYSTDLINWVYSNDSNTWGFRTLLGSKGYTRDGYGNVVMIDFEPYNSSTQFPVPSMANVGLTSPYLNTSYTAASYYIKT